MSTIDLASFGFKSIATTGSMAAGSNQITVAANSGFRVGDSIIVEVGGEAGDGMRGTVGVGGVYAATTTDPNLYYTNTMAPKALVAKITGVSADGTTLTLDQSAVAATTNANVYYDNLPAWNAAMASSNESGMTVRIPEGSFAASGALQVMYKTGWTIDGAGKDATELFSPDGARSLTMSIFESDNTTVSDFELRGNAKLNGYGLDQYNEYPGGIHFTLSDNGVARDITVTDVFQKAVGVDYSSNVWAYNVDAHLTEGLARYIQWQFQWANSFGGGAVDCSVDSATLTEGFEAFLSQDVSFIRVTGNNAVMAMNSSGNFYIEDAKLDFDANTWISNLQFHWSNPIININSNFAPNDPNMAQGGTIVNVQMHQDGYLNAAGDLLQGIVVNENNSNVTIVGGSYESPDFVATSMSRGPLGVNSIGTATYVNGFTVIGDNSQYNINVADGAVLNSVAGSIGVKTNYQITPASVFEGGAAQASGTVSAAGGFQTPSDLVGAYGVFTFNASTGAWTYTLDDGLAATKALAAGVVTHDVLAVRSLDGSVTRFIDVTVNGANDGGALADEIDLGGGANVAVEGADIDDQVLHAAGINTPPTFTSNEGSASVDINIAENTGSVMTVVASDPDGDGLTYSIIGGADSSLFALDATTGALSFVAAPNFEASADADGDNVYEVTVEASDGEGGTDAQAIAVTVTNVSGATINGTNLGQTLTGTGEEDFLFGLDGVDTLIGGGGDDYLDGGAANDAMTGGTGDDTYVVDNVGDSAREDSGAGIDTVLSTITYALGAKLENLTLTLTNNVNATGNASNNLITGNAGNNILAGLGGADTLNGSGGTDTASYAASAAGVNVSLALELGRGGDSEGDALVNIENLTGSALNDTLEGNAGNNVLVGGTGTDTLSYANAASGVTVSLAITAVQKTGGGGRDTISGFENLTGSTLNDVLTGSASANVIIGLDGNDLLFGGGGADTLTGGSGADKFGFTALTDSAPGSFDVITDFAHAIDKIDLSAIDANSARQMKGNQLFAYEGNSSSVVANSITWFESGGKTIIQSDVNGDTTVDFMLVLTGINHNLAASDFVL